MRHSRAFAALLMSCICATPTFADDEPRLLTYSSGTGFFVRKDGLLLTNNHVVQHCKEITVYGAVPETPAKVVAVDALYDLALVKTDALPLSVASFNSEKQPLSPRDRVVVVGYPGQSWQTGQTVTREATILQTRGPRGEEKWLEFSDSLAGGNSGGPLLDNAGNVVGVVTAKGHLISPPEEGEDNERVEHFDLAISLPVIRGFLKEHKVKYQNADSGIYNATDAITDSAHMFVVNVRCRWDEKAAAAAEPLPALVVK